MIDYRVCHNIFTKTYESKNTMGLIFSSYLYDQKEIPYHSLLKIDGDSYQIKYKMHMIEKDGYPSLVHLKVHEQPKDVFHISENHEILKKWNFNVYTEGISTEPNTDFKDMKDMKEMSVIDSDYLKIHYKIPKMIFPDNEIELYDGMTPEEIAKKFQRNIASILYYGSDESHLGWHCDEHNEKEYRMILCMENTIEGGNYLTKFLVDGCLYEIETHEGDVIIFDMNHYHKVELIKTEKKIIGRRAITFTDFLLGDTQNER